MIEPTGERASKLALPTIENENNSTQMQKRIQGKTRKKGSPMKIEELSKHGVPDEILNVWRESGVTGTLPIQDRAVQAGLFKGKSLLLVAPTSSGKNFVGEMVAVTHAMHGRKTLWTLTRRYAGR
jgi:superfamily II helicase